jgi:hypothetical protein
MLRPLLSRQLRSIPRFQPSPFQTPLKPPFRDSLRPPQPTLNPILQHPHRRFFHTTRPTQYESPRRPTYNRFDRINQVRYQFSNNPTFRYGVVFVVGGLGGFYIYNLEEVPITHRRRFNCMPPGWDKGAGDQMQKQVLSQYQGKVLPASDKRVLLVAKVLNRLIPASGMPDQVCET